MRFLIQDLVVITGLAAALTGPVPALAEEDDWSHHRNHLALILGASFKTSKDAFTYGIDYTYRLNERWEIGGWYEESSGDFELQSFGVVVNPRLGKNVPLILGLGVEKQLFKDDKALFRLGISYQFHPGSVTIAPSVWVDLIEDQSEIWFLGATVGMGF